MTVRYGLVGCGAVASHHISAIKQTPDAAFAGATDAREGAAEAFCAANGGRAFPSFEKMIESPDVDAVCILTPSGLHASQTIQAVRAGKHVLVEKPLALTVDQADAVIEAVEKSDVRVGVVSQYRFMDDREATELFREMTESGEGATEQLLTDERPDIYLLILESFSSKLMKTLGGNGVAQELDSLAKQGVLFTHFHANSFRTDRGLVSILSGYPAQPTMSLMRRLRCLQLRGA